MANPKELEEGETVAAEMTVIIDRAGGFTDTIFARLKNAEMTMEREVDEDGEITGIETWSFEGIRDY